MARTHKSLKKNVKKVSLTEKNVTCGDKALVETNQALDLDPDVIVTYGNLGLIYLALNRTDDASTTMERARARKLDGEWLHQVAYEMAFLRNDPAGMDTAARSKIDEQLECLALPIVST